MTNFPIESLLSPLDFEYLVRDLLSAHLKIDFQVYVEGPDKGIDLRYMGKNKTIVQCKRRATLSEKLLKKERENIEKLKIDCYYIATSANLSAQKIDLILKIFEEWMLGEENIYTKNKINRLLEEYPNVLRQNYKLWITSATIFDQFINQDLIGRSKFLLEDILNDLKFYVKNESFNESLEILKKYNTVIISGIPGIGKTTLAKLIIWEYLQLGYEAVEIRNINEGERYLKEDPLIKQVFYFDDFLGENFLEFDTIGGRSNDLNMFIKRISKRKNKILILTTREYILKQAQERYSKLNDKELNMSKYILDLDKYSKKVKAQILYNHLYYSDVGIDYIRSILKDEIYKEIIEHENYNPRIIEAMTIKLGGIEPKNYGKEFLENLTNPHRVWREAYEKEITKTTQYLLIVFSSINGRTTKKNLEDCFKYFLKRNFNKLQIHYDELAYKKSLKESEDTFIKISINYSNDIIIDFQNPSIKDFLLSVIGSSYSIVKMLIQSFSYFEQYITVYECVKNNQDYRFEAVKEEVVNLFVENFHAFFTASEYSIDILEKIGIALNTFELKENSRIRDFIKKEFLNISSEELANSKYVEIYLDCAQRLNLEPEDIDKILTTFMESDFSYNELDELQRLKNLFPLEFDQYLLLNKWEFKNKVDNILERETRYTSSKSRLEEQLEIIENLEEEYRLEFEDAKFSVKEKLSEAEEKIFKSDSPNLFEDKVLKDKNEFNLSSLFNINMFKT